MFFELLAIETKMIWNLFTTLTLLLLAFWTLKPVLGVMSSHWRSYHFSIKSFLGSISRLSFFELILLMTLLAFNQIESFRIKLTLKFAQNSSINNILDLIIDNLHFAILSRTDELSFLFYIVGSDVISEAIFTHCVKALFKVGKSLDIVHFDWVFAIWICTFNCFTLNRSLFEGIMRSK